MSIHSLKKHSFTETQNAFGETPLPFAPHAELANGQAVVPQQYLNVKRNLETLEAVIERIEFSDKYPIFSGEINGVLYLQVAAIGVENYPANNARNDDVKIVYGRRWLIEPTTPTSEVVQTAMLAIKKVREHELREHVVKSINQGKNKTTPFNTHLDLPQMAYDATTFSSDKKTVAEQVTELEQTVCIDCLTVKIHKQYRLSNHRVLLEIDLVNDSDSKINPSDMHFPELVGQRLELVCDANSSSDLMHELMTQLVRSSDRYVEEALSFNGFRRFSRSVSVEKIAEFSYRSRSLVTKDPRFNHYFQEMSYHVDSSKAPPFAQGSLGERQRAALAKHGVTAGYRPLESSCSYEDSFAG